MHRGLGPVGMMAAYLAKTLKKARRVVAIDKVREERIRKLN
jgi:threonine dehydrogenase-like Zn-dependent dehydrogenase